MGTKPPDRMARSLGHGRRATLSAALVLLALGVVERVATRLAAQPGVPQFDVDPRWPTLPPQWTLGQVTGVAVDAGDHVWILHRPWSLTDDEKAQNPDAACCTAAPPVLEFDSAGRYLRGWGGPGDGYEWPEDEHAIHVDHKRNVWISSAGGPRLREAKENQILKFTSDGRFLMQIGRRGRSTGSLDTANVNNAADLYVEPTANELYVADGYVNRRVIVYDADTGVFKRMWGAYGRPPDDAASKASAFEGPPPAQFNLVHGIRVSSDGKVYVNDRRNNRMQVFTTAGTFEREIFVARPTRLLGTSFAVAFSPDAAQRWLYLADAGNGAVRIYDRSTLAEVGRVGRIGRYAGQFVFLHALAVDSRGDLYTAEVGTGRRVQKFVRR
jgi:DNA-binding beta-propeller fold protein YncE